MWNRLYKQWENTANFETKSSSVEPDDRTMSQMLTRDSHTFTDIPKLPLNKMCIPYESAHVNA